MATHFNPTALIMQREANYLVACIRRKREILGADAEDLDHAIEAVVRASEAIDLEFKLNLDELLSGLNCERDMEAAIAEALPPLFHRGNQCHSQTA